MCPKSSSFIRLGSSLTFFLNITVSSRLLNCFIPFRVRRREHKGRRQVHPWMKVIWHLPLLPGHLPCFVCTSSFQPRSQQTELLPPQHYHCVFAELLRLSLDKKWPSAKIVIWILYWYVTQKAFCLKYLVMMLQDPRDRLWKEDICFRQKYTIISKTDVHLSFRFHPWNASLFPEVYFDPLG